METFGWNKSFSIFCAIYIKCCCKPSSGVEALANTSKISVEIFSAVFAKLLEQVVLFLGENNNKANL